MEQPTPKHEPQPERRPRIYVASLSDYNAGRLHGAWIDADQEPDEIHTEIQRMLATSSEPIAEEWAIHDYEDFGPLRLAEYADINTVADVAAGIEEHGEAFAAWVAHIGLDDEDLRDRFADAYIGTYRSVEEYAQQYAEDIGLTEELVPDWARPYMRIDIEALARDVEIELAVVDAQGGGVHVFDPTV